MPPHFSIVDVMKTWTENIGYPVLNVKRNIQNKIIEIEQVSWSTFTLIGIIHGKWDSLNFNDHFLKFWPSKSI